MPSYHITTKDRLENILQNGLKINSDWGLFTPSATQSFISEVYGMRPIFISFDITSFQSLSPSLGGPNEVVLEIDITGLPVVADVPSLMEVGRGYYDEEKIWFEEWNDRIEDDGIEDDRIEDLENIAGEDNQIYYEDLIDPHHLTSIIAQRITSTGAIMQDVGPERISIL